MGTVCFSVNVGIYLQLHMALRSAEPILTSFLVVKLLFAMPSVSTCECLDFILLAEGGIE
jgi:hypothetical protein